MTLAVSEIRWDILANYIKTKGPNKPMEDHPELQEVDGKKVILREGICVDPTIKSYPIFLGHLVAENPIEASLLFLDPVEKKGMLMIGASIANIGEDANITEIHEFDSEKAKNLGLALDDQAMKNLAVSHKDIYLKILRQMNIV